MGKRKKDSKKREFTPRVESITENALFMEYYKRQAIVPEAEWPAFIHSLSLSLPTSFRITRTTHLAATVETFVRKFEKIEIPKNLENSKNENEILKMENLKIREENEKSGKIESSENLKSGNSNISNLDTGAEFEAPRQLSWYPGGAAWQTTVSRRAIKKIPILGEFHQFLISQNEHGNIIRQEVVSMLPPLFMEIESHHKILDMCAAPGSKTSQLIEMLHANSTNPEGFVIANDLRPERSYLLVNQVQRFRSPSVIISCHEAQNFPLLFQRENEPLFFDRILCDAPCSGDGTIRKNRDMIGKWNPFFGINQHRQQVRIAQRGLELLKVGGFMIYSTCSFNPVENEAVVMELLRRANGSVEVVDVSAKYPDLQRSPGMTSWEVMDKDGIWFRTFSEVPEEKRGRLNRSHFCPSFDESIFTSQLPHCVRIFPHKQNTGGFFLSLFRKIKPMPPSAAFLTCKAHREGEREKEREEEREGNRDKEGEGERGDEKEGEREEEEMEVAMMEELSFGKRTGKQDRHFLEKKFKLFTKEMHPIIDKCNSLYGFTNHFPFDQLLIRSDEAPKIYIVSKSVMDVFTANQSDDRLRIVNMGLKLLTAHEGDAAGSGYRICQTSANLILPFISKRIVNVIHSDILILLKNKDPFVGMLSEDAKTVLMKIDVGPCLLVVEDKDSPCYKMVFSAWRGKTSVYLLTSKQETACYKFLLCNT